MKFLCFQNEKPSIDKKQPKSQAPTEKKEEKTVEIHTETEETDHVAAGDSGVVSEHKEHDKKTKQVCFFIGNFNYVITNWQIC